MCQHTFPHSIRLIFKHKPTINQPTAKDWTGCAQTCYHTTITMSSQSLQPSHNIMAIFSKQLSRGGAQKGIQFCNSTDKGHWKTLKCWELDIYRPACWLPNDRGYIVLEQFKAQDSWALEDVGSKLFRVSKFCFWTDGVAECHGLPLGARQTLLQTGEQLAQSLTRTHTSGFKATSNSLLSECLPPTPPSDCLVNKVIFLSDKFVCEIDLV